MRILKENNKYIISLSKIKLKNIKYRLSQWLFISSCQIWVNLKKKDEKNQMKSNETLSFLWNKTWQLKSDKLLWIFF